MSESFVYILFGNHPEPDEIPVLVAFGTDAERAAFYIGVEMALGEETFWTGTSIEDRFCIDCAELCPPEHNHDDEDEGYCTCGHAEGEHVDSTNHVAIGNRCGSCDCWGYAPRVKGES